MQPHLAQLEKRKKLGTFRTLRKTESLIDFSSNDYLGIARSAYFNDTVLQRLDALRSSHQLLGSTGSRLLTGNVAFTEELETKIAHFHGFESALLFNSGYMANMGIIASCIHENDTLLFDTYIHASMQAGKKLCKATSFAFRHNDLDHLEERLRKVAHKQSCYVLIESVYGTDGSIAPLCKIADLAFRYGAYLIVDEAHAVGLFGKGGRGLVYHYQLQEKVFAHIVTFGKALGTLGAIVLSKSWLKDYLINFASSFIYTTALPLCNQLAIDTAYDLLPFLDEKREKLFSHVNSFHNLTSSKTQIQPIRTNSSTEAYKLQKILMDYGFDVRALVSPTVRRGHEILRICLHAFNTEDEVLRLQEVLQKYA